MTSPISQFLWKCREQKAFSGAVYAYGNASGVVQQGAVGTLAWDGIEVRSDTLFDLASVTKPIVALVLMRLLESGEVCLDDTIAHFLPEYRLTDKAELTLFELLTHTSGIPGQQPLFRVADTRERLMLAVKQLPLRFKPGTNVEYTSQGFMIVGDIIEAVTGQRLDRALQDMVLGPVGMNRTLFQPSSLGLAANTAATEYCEWRGRIVQGEVHDENAVVLGGIAGHAGLFGTAADLSLLAQALLRGGETATGAWLRPENVELMSRRHTPSHLLARCLGWQGKDAHHSPAGDLFSPQSYGHTGFTGTSLFMDPAAGRFAVLLTNRVHPSRDNGAIMRIRSIFHNMVALALS